MAVGEVAMARSQARRNANWEQGSLPPGHWKRDGLRPEDREGVRHVPAKFPSHCPACLGKIEEGDEVAWHPVRQFAVHPDCLDEFLPKA